MEKSIKYRAIAKHEFVLLKIEVSNYLGIKPEKARKISEREFLLYC